MVVCLGRETYGFARFARRQYGQLQWLWSNAVSWKATWATFHQNFHVPTMPKISSQLCGNPNTSQSSSLSLAQSLGGLCFCGSFCPLQTTEKCPGAESSTTSCLFSQHCITPLTCVVAEKQNTKQCTAILPIGCAMHAISPFTYEEDQWRSMKQLHILFAILNSILAQQITSAFHCISTSLVAPVHGDEKVAGARSRSCMLIRYVGLPWNGQHPSNVSSTTACICRYQDLQHISPTHTHLCCTPHQPYIFLSMAHDQWIRLQEHGELGTLLTVEGPLWGRVTGRRRRWDWLQEEF